jgi:hypothetical protein
MSRIVNRFVPAVLVAAALWTGSALTASVEPIQTAAGSNCTYYSDASHTTVVGEFGKDCCNNQVARGRKTQYSVCSSACLPCVPPPVN